MKAVKYTTLCLCGALLLAGCGTMNKTTKGGIIGGSSGAAAGAIIGSRFVSLLNQYPSPEEALDRLLQDLSH